jgi:uncharacterized protein YndB with AHSA1/START domain
MEETIMATSTAATTGKTTFTEPSDRQLRATRTFDAPRRLVWQAHTDPKHLPHWLTGPEGWSLPTIENDLRPGGRWHYVWKNKSTGETMEMDGDYKEVTVPERIVNTERWGGDYPETLNVTTFTEKDGKTIVTVTVEYPNKKALDAALATGMKEGWAQSYDRLDEHLRGMK